MAAKTLTKYEADNGDIHPILIGSDIVSVAGTAPSGSATSGVRAKVSKSNREYGIRPRGVVLSRTVGTAPNTFKRYKFLPCLTESRYNALTVNSTVEINSVNWTVVTLRPEDF